MHRSYQIEAGCAEVVGRVWDMKSFMQFLSVEYLAGVFLSISRHILLSSWSFLSKQKKLSKAMLYIVAGAMPKDMR